MITPKKLITMKYRPISALLGIVILLAPFTGIAQPEIESFRQIFPGPTVLVGDQVRVSLVTSLDEDSLNDLDRAEFTMPDGSVVIRALSGKEGSAQATFTVTDLGLNTFSVEVFDTGGGPPSFRDFQITVLDQLPALDIRIGAVSVPSETFPLNATFSVSYAVSNARSVFSNDLFLESAVELENRRRTAFNLSSSGFLNGTDIYGNEVFIGALGGFVTGTENAFIPELEPEESVSVSIQVRIPSDDGTLHNTSGGAYRFLAEIEYDNISGDSFQRTNPSPSNIKIEVIPNLILSQISYTPGTYRGGDIIEITYEILNQSRVGELLPSRPIGLLSGDEFRTNIMLTSDPLYDRENDFLLGFSEFGGFSSDGGPTGRFFPNARSTVRQVRAAGTPPQLPVYGDGVDPDRDRVYLPLPGDGPLDVGERLIVTEEFMIPNNFTGTFFVAGETNVLQSFPEQETGVSGAINPQASNSMRPQGDNILVVTVTPQITIASGQYPNMQPVSEVTSPDGDQIAQSNGFSDNSSIDQTGNWIVFESLATNLAEESVSGNVMQIYLRNRRTGEIELVSLNNQGVPGNADSINPVISDNGRFVVYESRASNLVSQTVLATSNIYVRDLVTGVTRLLSRSASGVPGNGGSFAPDISADGRYVTFASRANNLDPSFGPEAVGTTTQVYVLDRDVTGSGVFDRPENVRVRLVSLNANGDLAFGDALEPAISNSGDAVAFASSATNLPLSNGFRQIYAIDLLEGVPNGSAFLVSATTPGNNPGNNHSSQPAINGGYAEVFGLQIAFASLASNLVPDINNSVSDIFVRDLSDLSNPITRRISISNERVSSGIIAFRDPFWVPGTAPANNPLPGERITINDGFNSEDFIFGTNVAIGLNAAQTRDNLVEAINTSGLNLNARASSQSQVNNDQYGVVPALVVFNTIPGTQGNVPIVDNLSLVVVAEGMDGGGVEAIDQYLDNPTSPPSGSLQPSMDRSGAVIAFRSLANNLSIFENPDNNLFGQWIRPVANNTSNVFIRDRDVRRTGVFDQADNTNTEKISNNRFGYPTMWLLGVPSSGSSRQPSVSADGRFVSISSDSENVAGLRFGRTNTQPLDSNGLRDVFVFDRGLSIDADDGSVLPRIIDQPGNRTLPPGFSVAFTVRAEGLGILNYQWQKNGQTLTAIPRISGTQTASLLIENLQPSDSGSYSVVVTNEFGSVVSSPATLVVDVQAEQPDPAPARPVITSQPQSLPAVGEGNVAVFTVIASGNPTPEFQWRKNGSDITGATSAQLRIDNVTADDSGSYDVVVSNAQGSVTSSTATLGVVAKPQITSQPDDQEVSLGGTAVFAVQAIGPGTLAYRWFKDGVAISGARSTSLTINPVKQIDAGVYHVVVSSAGGSSVTSNNVTLTIVDSDSGQLPDPGDSGNDQDKERKLAFTNLSELDAGWIYSPALGYLHLVDSSGVATWAFSDIHAWIYLSPAEQNGNGNAFWIFDPAMGWFFTEEAYASAEDGIFLYSDSDSSWAYYMANSVNPRWFYLFGEDRWESR